MMAPPAHRARIVRTPDMRLKVKKGIFSINVTSAALPRSSLRNGYQSRMSRTIGRLTAIGLLIRARIKKERDRKYQPLLASPRCIEGGEETTSEPFRGGD